MNNTTNANLSKVLSVGGASVAPIRPLPAECEETVISKIRQRRDAGRKKYGTSMERTDLSRLDWLRHAQEEAMDFAIYLERLIREEGK